MSLTIIFLNFISEVIISPNRNITVNAHLFGYSHQIETYTKISLLGFVDPNQTLSQFISSYSKSPLSNNCLNNIDPFLSFQGDPSPESV